MVAERIQEASTTYPGKLPTRVPGREATTTQTSRLPAGNTTSPASSRRRWTTGTSGSCFRPTAAGQRNSFSAAEDFRCRNQDYRGQTGTPMPGNYTRRLDGLKGSPPASSVSHNSQPTSRDSNIASKLVLIKSLGPPAERIASPYAQWTTQKERATLLLRRPFPVSARDRPV